VPFVAYQPPTHPPPPPNFLAETAEQPKVGSSITITVKVEADVKEAPEVRGGSKMAGTRVRMNYSEAVEALVNKQINMELYAGYVYLAMASFFGRDDQAGA
jgi:hypothetical protein